MVNEMIKPQVPEDKTHPYSEEFWSQVEILPLERLREIQWQRLSFLLKFVYENSPFYRRKWDEAGVKPSDIKSLDDLPKLPVILKQDFANDRKENPPFGTLATSPPNTHMKYFQTSGTTGKPQMWTLPKEEWEEMLEVVARGLYGNGIRSGWRGFFAFGFPPFPGLWGVWEMAAKLGCQNIPKGTLPTTAWLGIIKDLAGFAPSFLAATPTYTIRQLEVAKQMGLDPHNLKIDVIIVSGEPGYGIPATNRFIREQWGAKVIVDLPGVTETNGPFLYSCNFLAHQEEPSDHIVVDHWIFELLKPETYETVEKGEYGVKSGVACITALTKFGMPIIRFLANDFLEIIEGQKCGCGRTLPIAKGGIKTRADDMIIVKGVNIYPALIEDLVRSIPGLSPEYRIKKTLTGATVMVEPEPSVPRSEYEKLSKELQRKIKERALVTLDIQLQEPGSLPREEIKSKRTIKE